MKTFKELVLDRMDFEIKAAEEIVRNGQHSLSLLMNLRRTFEQMKEHEWHTLTKTAKDWEAPIPELTVMPKDEGYGYQQPFEPRDKDHQ